MEPNTLMDGATDATGHRAPPCLPGHVDASETILQNECGGLKKGQLLRYIGEYRAASGLSYGMLCKVEGPGGIKGTIRLKYQMEGALECTKNEWMEFPQIVSVTNVPHTALCSLDAFAAKAGSKENAAIAAAAAARDCWVITEARAPFKIVNASANWFKTWEFEPEEAIGKDIRIINGPDDNKGHDHSAAREVMTRFNTVEYGGCTRPVRCRNVSKTGRRYTHDLALSPYNGQVLGYSAGLTEIDDAATRAVRDAGLVKQQA
jgi:hypothetical protein